MKRQTDKNSVSNQFCAKNQPVYCRVLKDRPNVWSDSRSRLLHLSDFTYLKSIIYLLNYIIIFIFNNTVDVGLRLLLRHIWEVMHLRHFDKIRSLWPKKKM